MNIGKFSPGILFSHGEAPSENLLPNQRFGFEIVPSRTVSTSDNHYRDTRRGEHSLYSATEVAIGFEGFFIYCFCVIKQFEPAFCFSALFSCNLEFGEHICKALRILRLGDICEHA